MDLPDFTTYTDADVQALLAATSSEANRRQVLSSAESRLASLLNEYAAAGGDPAALGQKAPDVATAISQKRSDAAAAQTTTPPAETATQEVADTVDTAATSATETVGNTLGGLLGS